MKGFKAFNPDMTCRGMQYEIGKTYEMDCEPVICEKGFHFCETIAQCFVYYDRFDSVICEVEAIGGTVVGGIGKHATNALRVVAPADPADVSRGRYGYGYGNGNGDDYGNGNGAGYGYGNGNGDGDGYVYGNGDGSGCGYGYGNGYGYGDGKNIQKILNIKEG